MFKFGTIGAYKQVRNNPRCVAHQNLLVGQVVTLNEATKLTVSPTSDTAKGEVYVVSNIIDKPEIRSKQDFVVEKGEHVLAFRLADLADMTIEIDEKVVTTAYASVSVNDVLVADTAGKWVKTSAATGYKVSLVVLEKTSFGGKGLYCKVVVSA